MEPWTWLAAYLVGFALLQLVLYRYFQRGESTEGEGHEPGYKRLESSAGRADIGGDEAETAAPGTQEVPDRETVVCQQCGAHNQRDGMFSYCRECAGPLR